MGEEIDYFETYLRDVKRSSANTIAAYRRDLVKFEKYMEEQGRTSVDMVTATSLTSYVLYLEKQGMSTATISRSVASIRAFFMFLLRKGRISQDPSEQLKPPHVEKKIPQILSVAEVELLLEQPSGNSPKELRDKAMLELLYATGIRNFPEGSGCKSAYELYLLSRWGKGTSNSVRAGGKGSYFTLFATWTGFFE